MSNERVKPQDHEKPIVAESANIHQEVKRRTELELSTLQQAIEAALAAGRSEYRSLAGWQRLTAWNPPHQEGWAYEDHRSAIVSKWERHNDAQVIRSFFLVR
jgi:hypothetical protein